MTAFLVSSYLERGDLKLYLSNWNGYAQDASSVRYTIFARDGSEASGTRLSAIRRRTGEYYVPWIADVPNGNYRVEWEIQEEFGGPTFKKTDFFFVVDPSSYPCGRPVGPSAIPAPGQFTFLTGQALGAGDLPLFLRNSSGFLQDAFAVFWSIFNFSNGCMTQRTAASQSAVGTYFAPWYVNVGSGDYVIQWEFQQDQLSPLESVRVGFSVVCPSAPFVPSKPSMCMPVCGAFISCPCSSVILSGGGCCGAPAIALCSGTVPVTPTTNMCCDYEVPRVIHLVTGPIPPAGNFTSQSSYLIPTRIRKIAFYVTYTRGAPGGYPVVRLMWGDGVAETQETLIDTSVDPVQPVTSQNMYLQDLDGPIPPDGYPISFIVETRVPGGAKTVRLIAAEKGVPGAPGTIGITLTAATD